MSDSDPVKKDPEMEIDMTTLQPSTGIPGTAVSNPMNLTPGTPGNGTTGAAPAYSSIRPGYNPAYAVAGGVSPGVWRHPQYDPVGATIQYRFKDNKMLPSYPMPSQGVPYGGQPSRGWGSNVSSPAPPDVPIDPEVFVFREVQKPRVRKPNYTDREKKLILKLISPHLELVDSVSQERIATNLRLEVWKQITAEYNEEIRLLPGDHVSRDVEELKNFWKNLRRSLKSKLTSDNPSEPGIPSTSDMSPMLATPRPSFQNPPMMRPEPQFEGPVEEDVDGSLGQEKDSGGPYLLKKASHTQTILQQLMNDEAYADVTLTAEGKSIKAHRVVLSLASDYFRGVLTRNPADRNVIYFSDMKFVELTNIITFIYTGEVTLSTYDLENFMKTATKLGISSLKESSDKIKSLFKSTCEGTPKKPMKRPRVERRESLPHGQDNQSTSENEVMLSEAEIKTEPQFAHSPSPTFEPVIQIEVDKDPVTPEPSTSERMGSSEPEEATTSNDSASTSVDILPKRGRCPHCPQPSNQIFGEALQKHLEEMHPSSTAFICVPCSLIYVRHEWYLEHMKTCANTTHLNPLMAVKSEYHT